MFTRRLLTGGLVAAGLALAVIFSCDTAQAQSNKEKEIASRKGVANSLGTKELEGDKLPGTLEIGLAIGSTVASIAAIKWL